MHTSRHFNWAIVALLVLGTACDETTAPEANDLSTDELISIALDTDDGADVAIFGELGFLGAAGASAAPALVPETRIPRLQQGAAVLRRWTGRSGGHDHPYR